jgi:ATP-dependent DNA helicase RecQ
VQLHSTRQDIEKLLVALHNVQLLVYDKQKDKPQLTFTTVRFNATDLPLQARHIESRKQQELQKVQAVIGYITHKSRCRTLLLLEYFDEVSDQVCGVCDICLQKKKQNDYTDYYHFHRKQIIKVLSGGEVSLKQLVQHVKPSDEKALLETVREMAGAGEIAYQNNGNIYWVGS